MIPISTQITQFHGKNAEVVEEVRRAFVVFKEGDSSYVLDELRQSIRKNKNVFKD